MTLSKIRGTAYIVTQNPLSLLAFCLFAAICLVAVVGPLVVSYDPLQSNVAMALQPPSASHPFGTDQLGRDVLTRLVVATRLDLVIAISSVLIAFFVGSIIGATIGYLGGISDRVVGRFVDALMAFPLFVLAMAFVTALGNTVANVVYATAVINLPFYIRLSRAEVSQRRSAGYVLAAIQSGNSSLSIIFRFLLPNALPTLVIQMSLNMGWAILNAAGLSFIGLGVQPPTAEWGIMVAEGATFIAGGRWWPAIFPGAALVLTVFSFNLMGDALRDILDPRRRT
jgi:peptide/nickel transport system permease protein